MNPLRAVAEMITKRRDPARAERQQEVKKLETEHEKALQRAKHAARLASYGRIEYHRNDRPS